MPDLYVEDALGLSATVFNRNFVTSASEFQVQINATTRVVIKGSFGGPGQPPYTFNFDPPQVGSISSFEIWRTANVTSASPVLGKIVITGGFDRLETLFETFIMPADTVRGSAASDFLPASPVAVHEGTSTYFDIALTNGRYLRFLGHGLQYDGSDLPIGDAGAVYGVTELGADKAQISPGYTNFNSARLGIIEVSPLAVYMALFDDVLVPSFYANFFESAGLSVSRIGNTSGMSAPFGAFLSNQTLVGTAQSEQIDSYFGHDSVKGGGGEDVIFTRGGADSLWGGTGNDVLNAGAQEDRLFGEAGSDKLYGGTQNDRLTGGAGRDYLSGGAGGDRFIFTARSDSGTTAATRDQILDFRHAQGDKIDLSAIDAVPGGANNAFKLDSGGGFTRGEVKIMALGSDRLLYLNLDTDSAPELVIQLVKPGVFGVGDIIL